MFRSIGIPRAFFAALVAASFGQSGPAAGAAGLDANSCDALLTVTGAVSQTNTGDAAVFDRDMLTSLEPVTFDTETIWTDGMQSFTGVPLKRVLDHVGATGDTIRAFALNHYSVDIPVAELGEDAPIIAYLRNGEAMRIRDKGPLWIVYPYDQNPEYRSETVYQRSIWQLETIEVLE